MTPTSHVWRPETITCTLTSCPKTCFSIHHEDRFHERRTDILSNNIRAALDAMRAVPPVILLDDHDHDRENEADLIVVAERVGHTKGAVDLARMVKLTPAALLCELMNPDGTMMHGEQIEKYGTQHGLPILSIAEYVSYRQRNIQ